MRDLARVPESTSAPARSHRTRSWIAAAVTAVAVLASFRVARQLLPLASFAVAVAVMWAFGRLVARRVLSAPALGPWTSVYLGELAALAMVSVVTALNGTAAWLTGHSMSLRWIVAPAGVAAVLAELRTRKREAPEASGASAGLLWLLGTASLATVVAVYSRHLSALGLDSHAR